jgi:protein subunit release factor B
LAVSPEDVEVRYSRSGGSGGQNVNKVSTKAEVRFSLTRAESWVPRSVLRKLAEREASRINTKNVLVVTSSALRTQAANKQDAMGKLQSFLSSAALADKQPKPPSEIKVKIVKSLSRKAERRRADFKKHTSEKKHLRRQKYGPE